MFLYKYQIWLLMVATLSPNWTHKVNGNIPPPSGDNTNSNNPSVQRPETRLPKCSSEAWWIKIRQTLIFCIHHLPWALSGTRHWTGPSSRFPGRISIWTSGRRGCEAQHQVSHYKKSKGYILIFMLLISFSYSYLNLPLHPIITGLTLTSAPYVLSQCVIYFMKLCCLCVSYQDQSGEQGEDYETEEQLQARILTAALEFVPLHGWSMEAIASGAEVKISGLA